MLKRFLPLLALAAFAALSLAVSVPTSEAQDAPATKMYKPGKDITEAWGSDDIMIGQNLEGGDKLRYQVNFGGNLSASAGDLAATSTSDTSIISEVQIQDLHREWKSDDNKLSRQFTLKYLQLNIANTLNGKSWGMLVQGSQMGTASGKLYVDGKEAQWNDHRTLPNPSTMSGLLRNDMAFGRIGQSYELISPAHVVDWQQTHSRDLPAATFDPNVLTRLIFPGIGGKTVKVGEEMSIDAMLSVDTKMGRTTPFTIKLTPRKVLGEKTDASKTSDGIEVDVVASPASGSMLAFDGGLSVLVPELRGKATIDLKRGIFVAIDLAGKYTGQVNGDIHISLHLEEK